MYRRNLPCTRSAGVEDARGNDEAGLNDIFKMIERIQAVDTEGVEPMMHPHDGVQRLREDKVVFGNNREENMKNAPEEFEGLFLVPQVIE